MSVRVLGEGGLSVVVVGVVVVGLLMLLGMRRVRIRSWRVYMLLFVIWMSMGTFFF